MTDQRSTDQKGRRGHIGLAAFLLAVVPQIAIAECQLDRVDLRGDWGQASFQVELADEPEERQRGLMFRREMAPRAGMLFAYGREQTVAFWMRNTYLPLDLIFTDGQGVVQRIHHDAVPLDETLIHGGNNIQYVLEVNAGMAARLRLDVGSELRHPAIKDAAWSCE
jgi:uncharacterized membrane protein (UPF0127 family)